MDAKGFGDQLRAFAARDAVDLVQHAHRKITLEALLRLVMRTPVDTGRARGNWQVGIGTRPQGEVEVAQLLAPHKPPLTSLPPVTTAGQDAIRKGTAEVEKIPAFCVSHVTNNVAYILRLEEGGSRQAPGGMMALTFEELVQMLL